MKRERRGVNQDFGEIFAMVCILRILVLRSLRRTVFSSLFCLFSLFCVPRLAPSLYFHDLNFSNPGIFFFFFLFYVLYYASQYYIVRIVASLRVTRFLAREFSSLSV